MQAYLQEYIHAYIRTWSDMMCGGISPAPTDVYVCQLLQHWGFIILQNVIPWVMESIGRNPSCHEPYLYKPQVRILNSYNCLTFTEVLDEYWIFCCCLMRSRQHKLCVCVWESERESNSAEWLIPFWQVWNVRVKIKPQWISIYTVLTGTSSQYLLYMDRAHRQEQCHTEKC